ncbi:MAG: insulinase family protein [Pseudomonadota bacterium]
MLNIIFRWQYFLMLVLVACIYPVQAQQSSAAKISTLIKSDNDPRDYRYLTLSNSLKVLLISDARVEKSAAALNIKVGSNQNPRERPGLAHLLEHMLLSGTEKYPAIGEYQQFISQHGGDVNAHTAQENSNYFFDIDNAYLEPALDRFAQFFIAPLFNANYVEQERNSVNAEYLAGISNGELREWDVYRSLFNVEHPAATFSLGNLETLADREEDNVRDDLISFYQTYYSANMMTLVIVGNYSLNNLQKMVETRFAQIPNHNREVANVYHKLFPEGVLPSSVNIQSAQEARKLTIVFPVPRYASYYQTKPWNYLAHLLGGESPGSLLSLLKSLGWAEELAAGEVLIGQQDSLFRVSLTLTNAGVKAKDQIVSALFENIKIMSARGVVDWRFNEMKQMAELEFRFPEKLETIETVAKLSQAMHDYPAEDVLRGPFTYSRFDENLIKKAMTYLRKDNAMIVLSTPEIVVPAESVAGITAYYHTPYNFKAFIPEILELKSAYQQKLFLSERNIFIPKNTAIKPPLMVLTPDNIASTTAPSLLINNENFKVWFLQDQYYRSPKAELNVRFKLPLLNNSLENSARTQLFAALVMDQLGKYTSAANFAGLTFFIKANARGFDMYLAGYTDKQNLLLNKIIYTIAQVNFTQDRFEKIKGDLLREWQNEDKKFPYEVLVKKIPRFQYMPYWSSQEYADTLLQTSFESFKKFSVKLLSGAKIEALLYGNVYSQDAIKFAALMEHQLIKRQSSRLPQLVKVLRSENKNNKSWLYIYPLEYKDHAVALYVQAQSPSLDDAAHTMLLNQILQPKFYNQLRAEKPLGYVAELLSVPLKNVESSVFLVQSPGNSGAELIGEINSFLANASINLTENFAQNKESLLSQLREVPASLTVQADKYWQGILFNDKKFLRDQDLAIAVNKITPESLRAYYEAFFLQKNRRLWLSTDKIENLKDFEFIQNVADYQQKQSGYLYP